MTYDPERKMVRIDDEAMPAVELLSTIQGLNIPATVNMLVRLALKDYLAPEMVVSGKSKEADKMIAWLKSIGNQ